MASHPEIARALTYAAGALRGKELSPDEVAQRLGYFDERTGTTHNRCAAALRQFTGLSREELMKRAENWRDTDEMSRLSLKWML